MTKEIDATLVSHAFDAGNFAAVYVSTDLETAWATYQRETIPVPESYKPAFVLGFYASCERHEVDDLDVYDEAAASDVGAAVFAAGYVEPLIDDSEEEG